MQSLEIKKDIHWVGALDPNLRVFDIIMYTPYGTTYNSYVVKGSDKIAVFETVKVQFFDQYISRLKSLGIDITKIDYIVVDHTEPDHAGSVSRLLEISPSAKVIGSAAAIKFLKKIANKEFQSIIVNDNDTLNLGNKTLKFISAPMLHWPDSIYTYIPEDKTLITCDSFGSHYCFSQVFDDLIVNQDHYMEALKYYYDCIIGPYKPYMVKAINKIKDLKIETVCPGHGPILRNDPWKIINLYKEWSTDVTPKTNTAKKVTISYVSAYGYTEELANKISEGIKSTGSFEIKLYNIIYNEIEDILKAIGESDGVLFGSPTIVGELLEPVRSLMAKLNPVIHGGKVAAAFGSFGWSGEAVPRIETRLEELKMKIYGPGLKINFKPSEDDLQQAYEFGAQFGEVLLGKKNIDYTAKIPSNIKEPKRENNEIKFWKCLICGEIFEGEVVPEICSVCGAGRDQFIEVKNEQVEQLESNEKFIIIGNGAAGFYAAKSIREKNPKCSIKIISKENVPSYFRPQLSDLLTKKMNVNKFFIASDSWYKENKIEQLLGLEVKAIDKENKKITLANDKELSYDKLILANGSYNFIPPIKIINKEKELMKLTSFNYKSIKGIYTIKDLEDVNELNLVTNEAKNIIVIGGGLLGLEAAWELHKKGNKVKVVEASPRLLSRQLDREGSEVFKNIVNQSGIDILTDNCCVELLVDNNSIVGLKLKTGEVLSCELILFSIGIRSNISLPLETGLACRTGVIVNDRMETNIKDIYACGDVAELNGIVYGTWAAAVEMGKVAGSNAVSIKKKFKNFVSSVVFNALNANIFSAGTIDFDDESLEQITIKDIKKNKYVKLFFNNDKLVGGILIGNLSKSYNIITGIDNQVSKKYALLNNFI